MKYDFTSVIDRRGWDAIAVDAVYEEPGFGPDAPKEGFDVIPMWVADMNFKAVPTIQEAMIHRIEHPAYGYFNPSYLLIMLFSILLPILVSPLLWRIMGTKLFILRWF